MLMFIVRGTNDAPAANDDDGSANGDDWIFGAVYHHMCTIMSIPCSQ